MNKFSLLVSFFASTYITTQNMKFSIKNLSSKCHWIRSFLRHWSHLLKKSLMEKFIFCAIYGRKSLEMFYFWQHITRLTLRLKVSTRYITIDICSYTIGKTKKNWSLKQVHDGLVLRNLKYHQTTRWACPIEWNWFLF